MLARRLLFDGDGSLWATEAGWRMRMVLAWQRLVAGGRVWTARRRSSKWQADERRRMQAVAQRAMWPGAGEMREGRSLIAGLGRPHRTLVLHPCWRGKVNWRVFGQVMDRFTLRIRTAAEDRT